MFGAADGEPEGAVVEVVDDSWRAGVSRSVALQVCDVAGRCGAPADAVIEIMDQRPPTVRIEPPAACGAEATVHLAEPNGDPVDLTVTAAGRVVAQLPQVATRADGEVAVPVALDLAGLPNGRHPLRVRAQTGRAEAQAESASPLTLDRDPPTITFGAQPAADACGAAEPPTVEVHDGADAQPEVAQQLLEDGCTRTLRVTATDACGNQAVAERRWLVPEPVRLIVDGPAQGARVAQAAFTWRVDGPEACASAIDSELTVDGQARPYPMGAVIDQPGRVVLTVTVHDCRGLARQTVRAVTIAGGPSAQASPRQVPDGQPHYTATEGELLMLDGRASRASGAPGRIVRYAWDLDGDSRFDDALGSRPVMPTQDSGLLRGALQVTDDLGRTASAPLRVQIVDRVPRAEFGGPYAGAQGAAVRFDASASRGHAADAIARYVWTFGDGHTAQTEQPTVEHVYAADGAFEATVVVHDEDSPSAVARAAVDIADSHPQVTALVPPDDPRELAAQRWAVTVAPSAEPVTRVSWDFGADGQVEFAGPALAVTHTLETGGPTPLRITVRDADSVSTHDYLVDVRPASLAEALAWAEDTTAAAAAAPELPPLAGFALNALPAVFADGQWGERHARRGVTLGAVGRVVKRLRVAQGFGADVGDVLWVLSRAQLRAVQADAQAHLTAGRPGAGTPNYDRAVAHLDAAQATFGDADFRELLHHPVGSDVATAVQWDALRAWRWLDAARHPCQANVYTVPHRNRLDLQIDAADTVNRQLAVDLTNLQLRLATYAALGGEADPGPGAPAVDAAARAMRLVRDLADRRVAALCDVGEGCIRDREALTMLLEASDVLRELSVAQAGGAEVQGWQACLANALSFRTQASLLRMTAVCGARDVWVQRASGQRGVGLELLEDARLDEAIALYEDAETRCLMVDAYNGCLAEQVPEDAPSVAPPAECRD